MPSTQALIKAYGQIPIPCRIDEMTYQEADQREAISKFEIRYALMRLYERDVKTIMEVRSNARTFRP